MKRRNNEGERPQALYGEGGVNPLPVTSERALVNEKRMDPLCPTLRIRARILVLTAAQPPLTTTCSGRGAVQSPWLRYRLHASFDPAYYRGAAMPFSHFSSQLCNACELHLQHISPHHRHDAKKTTTAIADFPQCGELARDLDRRFR